MYSGATPFLAQDNNYKSVGAIKVPGAQPKQFGFSGLFLPTAIIGKETGPSSIFPDAQKPALALTSTRATCSRAAGRSRSTCSTPPRWRR